MHLQNFTDLRIMKDCRRWIVSAVSALMVMCGSRRGFFLITLIGIVCTYSLHANYYTAVPGIIKRCGECSHRI